MDIKKSLLITLAGPTAVGKTRLSIQLAKELNTSIFSSDSRQFYREISIGTAKPNIEELTAVKHFFINNKSIHDIYSAGDYENEIIFELEMFFKQKEIAFLVGGSGMYIDAVVKGLDNLPKDLNIREELNKRFKKYGIIVLQNELKKLDPAHYKNVDTLNPQRIIRSLEVCIITGKPYSSFLSNSTKKRSFSNLKFLLFLDKEILYKNINLRVDNMIKDGLIEEVESLKNLNNLNALNTVGYKEIFNYLNGKTDKKSAIEQIKTNTKKYSKRQMTWFKKDPSYQWINNTDIEKSRKSILKKIKEFKYD
ncbi:MAG: tRNA (adenosine(37)-N6)-dimethylallyltransferase MiaA [Parvicellaceae bacterium]